MLEIIKVTILINNAGNTAIYDQQAIFSLPNFPVNDFNYFINILPPYGNFEQNIVIPNNNLLVDGPQELQISINNQKYTETIVIKSPLPKLVRTIILKINNLIKVIFKK